MVGTYAQVNSPVCVNHSEPSEHETDVTVSFLRVLLPIADSVNTEKVNCEIRTVVDKTALKKYLR